MRDPLDSFRGWTYRQLAEWASRLSDYELNRRLHREGPLASLRPHVKKALGMFYVEKAKRAAVSPPAPLAKPAAKPEDRLDPG